MFATKKVSVTDTAAVELTDGIDLDQPTKFKIYSASGAIWVGPDSGVTTSNGYLITAAQSELITIDGDAIWARAQSGPLDVYVMAWTE